MAEENFRRGTELGKSKGNVFVLAVVRKEDKTLLAYQSLGLAGVNENNVRQMFKELTEPV